MEFIKIYLSVTKYDRSLVSCGIVTRCEHWGHKVLLGDSFRIALLIHHHSLPKIGLSNPGKDLDRGGIGPGPALSGGRPLYPLKGV